MTCAHISLLFSVAVHLPYSHVTALDLSNDALSVARENAAINHVKKRVMPLHSDLLSSVAGQAFDVVVSNPPYVEEGTRLAPEIARHEPAAALYAGLDGLAVVRRLVAQAGEGGADFLALEVGAGQAIAVEELARAAGFERTERRADLAGVDRVVVAWR